jgi:hypothetical protein
LQIDAKVSMTQKNENVHLFIIKEAYKRNRVKQNFNTSACALEDVFGAKFKSKSF